ncbi:MAG: CRISPR-associated RAMP protein Csx7 [Candidatus Hodarchaeota archaeon]
MLKKLFNELSFDLIIDTVDPIIIKSGKASLTGPDDNPVKTWRSGREDAEPFIPGSSLKGAFRSHIEKIVRTFNEEIVCIPYLNEFCGNKFQKRLNENEWGKNKFPTTELVYSESCPICRLFGSTFFKGRIAISDAYLIEGTEAVLEERDGVAIDRFTGGAAAGALFQLEVVSKAQFKTKIIVQNFECWQLGMIAILVSDLEDELIQIGSGTSRGFGRIKGTVNNFAISYFRGLANLNQVRGFVWGLGRCLDNGTYGTSPEDFFALKIMPTEKVIGIRKKYEFDGEALDELKSISINKFYESISNWTLPVRMRFDDIKRRN